MLVVLFVLITATCFAQTGQDALPLLREVAAASRTLTTYRAEGHIEQQFSFFGRLKGNMVFRVATRSPQKMRIEVEAAGDYELFNALPFTSVCDGQTGWLYFGKAKKFRRVDSGNLNGFCTPGTLTTFEHVADDVRSAVITGNGLVQFGGRSTPCVVVQAEYRVIKDVMTPPGMVSKIGHVSRAMCIDRDRKLILRDHLDAALDNGPDGDHVVETVTYDRIERNPELPTELFEFHPPEGATLFEQPKIEPPKPPPNYQPPKAPAAGSAFFHALALPEPVSKAEPEYSQEAWDEGIQGKVILLADIAPDGTIHDIKFRRSLGYGLDEKAIECVRKWRFNPATDDGKPVNGTAMVYMTFSLPDQRPDQPSVGPVARPVQQPRLPVVELKPPTDLDNFFYLVANKFKAPEACQKIQPMADGGGGGFSEPGFQIRSLQSDCYLNLAFLLHDASLCGQVKPVRTDTLDGSKRDKTYCATHLTSPLVSIATFDPHRPDPFVRLMQKLGYDDSQITEFRYRQSPLNNPTHVAYKKLLTDRDFLNRVHAAASYAESRSQAAIRPAYAAEYLYEMVADDTNDEGLCAKVSPNATFVRLGGQPVALLQSECYLNLAFNARNPAFCERLPSRGTFPHVNNAYDSLESCKTTVAVYSGYHYGPSFFPHPADFADSLEKIGYSRTEAAGLVTKPTARDYWEFLLDLSTRAAKQERDQFLRRAMSLQ